MGHVGDVPESPWRGSGTLALALSHSFPTRPRSSISGDPLCDMAQMQANAMSTPCGVRVPQKWTWETFAIDNLRSFTSQFCPQLLEL